MMTLVKYVGIKSMIAVSANSRVGNSLFRSLLSSIFKKVWPWANQSRCSLKKSDSERIALLGLYKRATVSKSRSRFLFKREASVTCLWLYRITLKKLGICSKKPVFFICFDSFPPFYVRKANCFHRSSLSCYFLVKDIDPIVSLSSLFTMYSISKQLYYYW